MSKGKVVAGLGAGVALGVAFGFYGLAPNVEGGPAGGAASSQQELREAEHKAEVEGAQSNAANAALAEVSDSLVANQLDNTRIGVISTPDADPLDVSATVELLESAGATVNSQLALTDKALATDAADTLKSIAAKSLPQGAQLSEDKLTPGMHTGQLLGSALFTEASESDRAVAIGALEKDGFIQSEGDVRESYLFVVVTGGAGEDKEDGNYANTFLSDFAFGMDEASGGVVLAGRPGSSDKGGAVALVRDSRTFVENVSTVDNIDTTAGQLSVVSSLVQQKDDVSRHTGVGGNAADPYAKLPSQESAN